MKPREPAADAATQIAEGARSQVWDPERVAQEIVAVEPDERVEVDEESDGGSGHDDERQRVGPHGRACEPPSQDGQGPENQLDVGAGKRHQKPLRLLGEEPGVAHVAVEGKLEVDEEEAHLPDAAAKVLAGQAMRELVHDRDEEDGQQGQHHRLEPSEAGEVARDLGPLPDRDAERDDNEQGREPDEVRRETESNLADEAVQQAIRIEGTEPQVE